MKTRASLFLCFTIVGVLTSCTVPTRPAPDSLGQEPSIPLLTQTAPAVQNTPAAENTPAAVSTTTPVVESLPTDVIPVRVTQVMTLTRIIPTTPQSIATSAAPLGTRVPGMVGGSKPVTPCMLAQPGRPMDISVPDETRFRPGENFSKTWRLINAGACSWTRDFALVWFSGDDLGVVRVQPFSGSVAPGQTIDLTIDMVAPVTPGMYQSNWKLRDGQGALFGIGPGGRSPFWVRIIVIAEETPTAVAPLPGLTPTPLVLVGAALVLPAHSGVDLDTGQLDLGAPDDLVFLSSEQQSSLAPAGGARLSIPNVSPPGLEDCALTALSTQPLVLDASLPPGTHLCYQTGEGRIGRLLLAAVDLENRQLGLEFLTWTLP